MKKQKPWLGFSLALLATMTWGSLPVIAQQALKAVDAPTLVWIRFLVASLVLFVLLGLTGKLPRPSEFSKQTLFLLVLGIIGISANFVLVAMGLHYISPTTTQVLWQLSPFTMILVGVGVFKEAFTRWQKIGLMLLLTGLVMFFNDKFGELFSLGSYAVGVIMAASGSMIWVCYGVAQKLLSKHFNSQQILLMIYFCSSFVFLPFAEPSQIAHIGNPFLWGCFIYCCLNTLIGYGSFGEALSHWDASKVSIVTTLIPVFTMIFSTIGHYLAPDYFAASDMNIVSYVGAMVVVAGALLAVAGEKVMGLFLRKI
ncbi:TPA: DMT family transporter [Neisseria subflava]